MAGGADLPEGFEDLYERSIDLVYSYARARLGPAEGEDVAGEVFEAALIAFQNGKQASVTEAWLVAVTRNKVVDRWRMSERRMAKRHLVATARSTPDLASASTDDTDRLLLAMDQLSAFHRGLLVLHYQDGFPMREVAEQLGTTLSSAQSGIARARKALRLAYEGVTFDV